jgi:hypothetical protein
VFATSLRIFVSHRPPWLDCLVSSSFCLSNPVFPASGRLVIILTHSITQTENIVATMPVSTTTDTANGQLELSNTNVFNETHENIEFEAPPSAELDLEHRLQMTENLAQHGRFSIDLSLELERQLNMESPPASFSYDAAAVPNEEQEYGKLDPDVLAHIVTQMRKSLVNVTKERDELVRMLAKANTQDTNTKDALQLMTERATSAGEELDIAKKKMKEDEEQIVLLRTKVEESR